MTDGEHFDDPNRQAVGLEPAWAEGHGGSDTSGGSGPAGDGVDDNGDELAGLTKDELIAVAAERGIEVSPADTKADIKAAIEKG